MLSKKDMEERFIVASNQTHWPIMALVYNSDDFNGEALVARIGSAYTDSSSSVELAPAFAYKLYFSNRRSTYYFKQGSRRFYLDETIRS